MHIKESDKLKKKNKVDSKANQIIKAPEESLESKISAKVLIC